MLLDAILNQLPEKVVSCWSGWSWQWEQMSAIPKLYTYGAHKDTRFIDSASSNQFVYFYEVLDKAW